MLGWWWLQVMITQWALWRLARPSDSVFDHDLRHVQRCSFTRGFGHPTHH
jgi:hypothetical protein